MGKDANELAMRDPAHAALLGVSGMSDFGDEQMFAGEEDDFGVSFGDDMGVSFGDDMGDEDFGAEMHRAGIHPAHARRIVAEHIHRTKHRNRRALLLEPNMHSDLKIERYTFSINQSIPALGTTFGLALTGSPDVNFRPERVTTNVVSPGMVFITDGRVANVSFTVGGQNDAWQFNANAVGQSLSVPTLTPANRASVAANYTGLVPSPLSGTGSYQFSVSFSGPATLSA